MTISIQIKYYLFFVLLISLIVNPIIGGAQVEPKRNSNEAAGDSLKIVKAQVEFDIAHKNLSDSVLAVMETQSDFDELQASFNQIRNKRVDLGLQYIPLLKKFAQHAKKVAYEKGEMKAYDFIGQQYRYDEIYDSAYSYHIKSLEMATRLKDSTQMFYNYNNLGQVFRMQDINALAIDYFHKALVVSNAIGNLRSSSFTMNTIGATLVVQKDYERAMKYFHRSSEIAVQRKDKRTLAYNYGSIGEIFLLKAQPDSAMYYFQISRNLLVELKSDKGMGVAEQLEGQAYFALKEYDKAQEKFDLALVYHKKDNNQRYQSLCNWHLGKIAVVRNDFEAALRYLDLAKVQAIEINSLKNLEETYDAYAEVYKQQGNWKKAFEAKEQSYIYRENIINEKNNSSIQALEIGFETKEKVQQIELLTTENRLKNQRIKTAVAVVLILVIVIFLILYILNARKKQAALRQNDLQQQVLRAQMNPHFIFNVLGSIQNFMMENDTRKASGFLSKFASLTRATLNNSVAETISLADEISMLRDYIELEKMRSKSKFNFEINFDEDLEVDFIQIPPMLIQPFVENSIKHGFKNTKEGGLLKLNITDKTDWIEFIIEDNGEGIQKNSAKSKEHKSMATQIFEKRRKLIQQKHNKDFKFEMVNLNDTHKLESGLKITINIPILNND